MTLDDAIKSAESGDIGAALALGKYYVEENEYDDAIKWYEIAAEAGYLNAMSILGHLHMTNGYTRSTKMMRTFYGIADILPSFLNSYKWCSKLVSIYSTATPTVDRNEYEEAVKNMNEAAYYSALYSYFCDKIDDALQLLPDISDYRTDILRGILLIEKDADANIAKSYRLLSRIENNHTYGNATKLELEDSAYGQGALYLALCYRTGYGTTPDLSKAVNVLKFVRDYIKDEDYHAPIDKEIARYQPKLFGGYKYI